MFFAGRLPHAASLPFSVAPTMASYTETPFTTTLASSRELPGTLTSPAAFSPAAATAASTSTPCGFLLLLHGMASHQDHSFAPALARLLAQRLSLHVLRYTSRGPAPHPAEPAHRFRVCGASQEDCDDLAAVSAHAVASGLGPLRALVGHSRGANTILYHAAAHSLSVPLVCLAPRHDLPGMLRSRIFSDAQRAALAAGHPIIWPNKAGDISVTPEDAALLHSLRDMSAPLAALPPRAPLLLCHGTADATIPHADSQAMAALRPANTQLLLLPGAPHNFAKGHEAPMAAAVGDFLAAQLGAA